MRVRLDEAFADQYGRDAQWKARAPGRVNLIGDHTDYNEGFVLPMAIEVDTQIAAALNATSQITLRSTAAPEIVQIDLRQSLPVKPKGFWGNYPTGVLAGFLEAGWEAQGFDALIDTAIPVGGGLSSSAALEVAFATLLEAICGVQMDPQDKVSLCRRAEHRYAQVPCGIMDQYICTLGRRDQVLLLDCQSESAEWIDFADPAVSILIINTGVRHELAGGEYAQRRGQCKAAADHLGIHSLRAATLDDLERSDASLNGSMLRRARHVICENERTVKAATLLRAHDWSAMGQLMYQSHTSLQQDFEVSCAELDTVVEIARTMGEAAGIYGCRMTGGGFGGCAVALIDSAAQESIARTIGARYLARIGRPATVMASRPAEGAGLMSLAPVTVT